MTSNPSAVFIAVTPKVPGQVSGIFLPEGQAKRQYSNDDNSPYGRVIQLRRLTKPAPYIGLVPEQVGQF